LGEPPSDHETGDYRRAGAQFGCRGAGLNATGGIQEAARVSFRRPEDHRRKARRTVETSGIIDNPPDIVFQVQRVSPDKLAIAAQLPDLVQEAPGEALSSRTAAKDDDVAAQKN